MTQQRDSKGELRAAFAIREIEKAQRSCHSTASGILLRVALAIIYMYLIITSYLMMGNTGPVFISVLSLVAFFIPYFYQTGKHLLTKRKQQKAGRKLGQESPQEA